MASVRQSSFASGELSPTLHGRTDLAQYATGLARCRNAFVSPHGAVLSRPGTKYVAGVKNHAKKVRLIPFVYSDGSALVLEFGHLYVRFHRSGAPVIADGGSTPFEVTTPYTESELPTLKYVQSGDVVTLCQANHPPEELRRVDTDWRATGAADTWSWTLTPLTFDVATSVLGSGTLGASHFGPPEWRTGTTYAALARVSFAHPQTGVPHAYVSLVDDNDHWPMTYDPGGGTWSVQTSHWNLTDAAQPEPGVSGVESMPDAGDKAWVWKVTSLMRDRTSGVISEWKPLTVTNGRLTGYRYFGFAPSYALHDIVTHLELQDGGTGQVITYRSKGGSNTDPVFTWADDVHWQVNDTWWEAYTPAGPDPQYTDVLPGSPRVDADYHVTIAWPGTDTEPDLSGPPWIVDWGADLVGWRVYRGRDGMYGLLGETTSHSYEDDGREPDYSQQPPSGVNPFVVTPFGGSPSTENPLVPTYFEQRLVFGATTQRPSELWASATGVYHNFDEHLVVEPDDALHFQFASRKREEVRSLLGLDGLLVFTNSSVWSVSGAGGDALSPTSIDAKVQEEVGSSWLDPLCIGGLAIYVRAKGTGVRGLVFDKASVRIRANYQGTDISLFAQHLFAGHTVVDWTYAEDPDSLVWAVRDDGVLLCCTLNPEHQLVAWSWHDSPGAGGVVENVCAIPEGDEDALYLVVRRTVNGSTKRYLERMSSRHAETLCLDCAREDGDDPEAEPVTVVSNLEHLEGLFVKAVADGVVVNNLQVSGGQVTLPFEATRTQVGLAYTPEIQPLEVHIQGTELRTRTKTVREVTLEVEASRGLWVGEDEEHLFEWRQREVGDDYGAVPAATTKVQVAISSTWNLGGRVFIRQVDPLPLSLLGLTREVEVGG